MIPALQTRISCSGGERSPIPSVGQDMFEFTEKGYFLYSNDAKLRDRGGKSERQIALALRTLSKCVKVERVISTSAFGKNGKRKEHTP